MNLATSLALILAAGALGAWALSTTSEGNRSVQAAEPANAIEASRSTEPTAANLEERSRARWAAVCRGDWIAAYEFQTSEQKLVPLANYLQGKGHHVYANPAVERVIEVGKSEGYVLVRVVWTPTHPELQRVKLEPGQTLTEELRMIETWRWEGQDWGYVRAQRPDEFEHDHPKLEWR